MHISKNYLHHQIHLETLQATQGLVHKYSINTALICLISCCIPEIKPSTEEIIATFALQSVD